MIQWQSQNGVITHLTSSLAGQIHFWKKKTNKQMLTFWASFPSLPVLYTVPEKAQELVAQNL